METETPVSVPWPRPCDVVVEKYYNVNYMLDDLNTIIRSTEPETLTERRLRLLIVSENLLAYPDFWYTRHYIARLVWPKIVKATISKFEEHAENITTFDANEYIEKLKALL